eukprot:c21055_g2_i1 orf=171-1703(-)
MSNRHRREDRRSSEVYGGGPGGSSPHLPHNLQVNSTAREVSLHSWYEETRSSRGSSVMKELTAGGRKKGGHGGSSTKSNGVAGGGPGSISSESMLSQAGYDRYEGFYEKRRSAMGVITGIFTCWSKTKDVQSGGFQGQHLAGPLPRLNGLTAAALLEQAKAQQEALLETQDTSDMWEWHMEQQQAIASQEHEMLERTSNAAISDQLSSAPPLALLPSNGSGGDNMRPLVRHKKPPEDETPEEDAEDDATQEWGSPAWGWRRQEEIAAEKVSQMFEAALLRCRWEINTFCRVYMQQIVKSGYSLINTLMEMEANTVFLRRVHSSYALEARINAALFRCFENDSFDDSGLTHIFDPSARAASRLQEFVRMKGLDPAEALRMHSPSYEPAFHNFAAVKSEEVLALLPAAALAFRSAAQRDNFMDAFLRAAKWAWLLHRLATSATQQATILRVARGHRVDPLYVEAVAVPPIGSCSRCPVTALPTVEFMIMPGFVTQRKVFRCRIYQHFMCKQQ